MEEQRVKADRRATEFAERREKKTGPQGKLRLVPQKLNSVDSGSTLFSRV
jgi:hypothetical protein